MDIKTVICINNTDTDLILYKKYKVRYSSVLNEVFYTIFDENDNYINTYTYIKDKFKAIDKIRQERLYQLI